jgi:hypothetical protein
MKIIKSMIVFASLFAIAGAAFLQLLLLVTNRLFTKHHYQAL